MSNQNYKDIVTTMKYYKTSGTNKGDRINVGNGSLNVFNEYSPGLPVGNLMPYTFLPTYDDNAFNSENQAEIAAGSTAYIPLGTLTAPAGKQQYLTKIMHNNQILGVKLDYSRPITIASAEPFTAIISGYDRTGQKSNMQITGEQGTYSRFNFTGYLSTSLRALDIVTAIQFTNTGVNTTTPRIILDKIVEFPYLSTTKEYSFNLIWGWMNGNSICYSDNFLDPMSYKGGQLLGGNSQSFLEDSSIYFPLTPTEATPNPQTLTENGPRILWNLGNTTAFGEDAFPFDQETLYTLIFVTTNPYETAQQYYFEDTLKASPREYLLGYNNYADDLWSGWRG